MRRFLIVVALLLSGCVDGRTASCVGDDCPRATSPPNPPALLPAITFEDCEGVLATFDVPTQRASVPDAFWPNGPVASTARVRVDAIRCGRVVTPAAVHPDVGLFSASLQVIPRNASWSQGLSYYELLLQSTDASVARALAEAGAESGETRLDAESSTGLGGTRLVTWTFTSPNGTHRLTWPVGEATGTSAGVEERHLWFGADPYRRLDLESDARAWPLAGAVGLVELADGSPLGPIAMADLTPSFVRVLSEARWAFASETQQFEMTP